MAVQYTPSDLVNHITQNNYSYKNSYKKKITQVNEDVEKLQDNMASFNKSVKWLKKYKSGASSMTRLEKEIKSLVKSYNGMSQNKDSITDKDIQKQMSKLDKLFTENTKNFKKIGVEKVKGKYVLDSKKFEDADEKALSALFEGYGSFVDKAEKVLRKAESSAEDIHYDRIETTINNAMNYKESDVNLAKFMILAQQTGSILSDFNSIVQSGVTEPDFESAIKTDLSYFAIAAYKKYENEPSGSLYKMQDLCIANEEKLNKVGMTFDADKKQLEFDMTTDLTTQEFKDAYNELFGKGAEFGKKIYEYAGDVFNAIIKPDKIGVSLIDVSV